MAASCRRCAASMGSRLALPSVGYGCEAIRGEDRAI